MSRGKYIFSVKFEDIFPKICDRLQTKNQTKIAKFFDNMTPGALTNFKKRNSFPMNRVVEFSQKSGLPVESLLGNAERPEEKTDTLIVRDSAGEPVYGRRMEDKYYVFLRLLTKEGRLEAQKKQFLRVLALRDWLVPQVKGVPDNAFMTVMEGDSMNETISPGDILFCDGQTGKISDIPIEDAFYIISIDGGTPIIRRLQGLPNKTVKVIADNSRYDSFSISKDYECQILGKVIWIAKKT